MNAVAELLKARPELPAPLPRPVLGVSEPACPAFRAPRWWDDASYIAYQIDDHEDEAEPTIADLVSDAAWYADKLAREAAAHHARALADAEAIERGEILF